MSKTIDPSKRIFNFAGITVTGYMKGTHITVKRNAPKWTFEPGVHEGVYIKGTDDSAIFEITLQGTSPSNRDLSNQYKKDKKDGSGKGAISLEDLNTDLTVFAGGEARILSCPDWEGADSLTACVWQIHCSKVSDEFIDGANS